MKFAVIEEIIGCSEVAVRDEARMIASAEAARKTKIARQADRLAMVQAVVLAGYPPSETPLEGKIVGLYGGLLAENPEVYRNCQKIDEALKGKMGQLAVTVYKHTQDIGFSPSFGYEARKYPHYVASTITMAVLSGEDLAFDLGGQNKTVALPTEAYASHGRYLYEGNMAIDNSDSFPPIKCSEFSVSQNMGKQLDLSGVEPMARDALGTPMAGEILIGQDAIDEWLGAGKDPLARNRDFKLMRACCRELGIEAIEGVTSFQQRTAERETAL